MTSEKIVLPYGRETVAVEIEEGHLAGVLRSGIHGYRPPATGEELVRVAMAQPIGTPRLRELAAGKRKVVVIASDHTRPVPSRVIMPQMLAEIRTGNPSADITILVATGLHRTTTLDELATKFGDEIVARERIVVHDCDDTANLVNIGRLPSGGDLVVNRLAVEADLLVAEGFIEPHFFAGFSGGRKSILPGVASRKTVMANHCSEFIASDCSRTGILKGNPIHKDMVWAARQAKLRFICNVVIDSEKKAIYAVSGDLEKAHEKGCSFLSDLCGARKKIADIVITTNGGYPLDQNIYQSVKGMTAAEASVRDGGVIIMLAACNDGHGGQSFFDQLANAEDLDSAMDEILSRGRDRTIPDQWEAQILIRILRKAHVILVSEAPDEMVRAMHMTPADSLKQAMEIAEKILGNGKATVTAIPDGVSVMVL